MLVFLKNAFQNIFKNSEREKKIPFYIPPKRALLKHVLRCGIDGPVVALPRPTQPLRQLDEAVVQGEVMSHRVLPSAEHKRSFN